MSHGSEPLVSGGSICDLDQVTQPQADTLTLEDLRVTVCGTGDVNIDGKTVSLDKVAGLFGDKEIYQSTMPCPLGTIELMQNQGSSSRDTTPTDSPTNHYDSALFVVVGDNGYFIGGSTISSGNTINTTTNIYNFTTNTRTGTIAGLPNPGGEMCISKVGTDIYCIGGIDFATGSPINTVRKLNTLTNTWSVLGATPAEFRSSLCASIGTNIYVFGGITTTPLPPFISKVNAYKYDTLTNVRTAIANLPTAISRGGTGIYGENIIIGGGITSTPAGNGSLSVYIYNTLTNSYTIGANIPTAVESYTFGFNYNNSLVISGGRFPNAGYADSNLVQVYNAVTNSRSTESSTLVQFGYLTNTYNYKNKIGIVGGRNTGSRHDTLKINPIIYTCQRL